MQENIKIIFGILIKAMISLLVILGLYLVIHTARTNKIENTQTVEEPEELDKIKYYTDSYNKVIKRVLKHTETLEGENLLREVELSKIQKAEIDIELLSDGVMLDSVAYHDIESFRLKTDEFLNILEMLARKEKVPVKDSKTASEWWGELSDLLNRYYTKEEKSDRMK